MVRPAWRGKESGEAAAEVGEEWSESESFGTGDKGLATTGNHCCCRGESVNGVSAKAVVSIEAGALDELAAECEGEDCDEISCTTATTF